MKEIFEKLFRKEEPVKKEKTFIEIAKEAMENDDYEKAELYYNKAIAIENEKAMKGLADLYEKREELKKSQELYMELIKKSELYKIDFADFLYRQEKYEEAEKFYLEYIENKNKSELYYNFVIGGLINIYMKTRKFKKAKKLLLKLIEDGQFFAYSYLGNIYEEEREYDKAEECYRKGFEETDIRAGKYLAIMLYTDGHKDEEENIFSMLSEKMTEEEKKEYFIERDISESLGLVNKIMGTYIKFSQKIPESIEEKSLLTIKRSCLKVQDLILELKGKKYYKSYLMFILALTYMKLEEYDEAQKIAIKMIENYDSIGKNFLGKIYYKQGKNKIAEKWFQESLKEDDFSSVTDLLVLYDEQYEFDKFHSFALNYLENYKDYDEEIISEIIKTIVEISDNRKDVQIINEFKTIFLELAENKNIAAMNALIFYYMMEKNYEKEYEWIMKAFNLWIEEDDITEEVIYNIRDMLEFEKYQEVEEWTLKLLEKVELKNKNEYDEEVERKILLIDTLIMSYQKQKKYKEAENWILKNIKIENDEIREKLTQLLIQIYEETENSEELLKISKTGNVEATNALVQVYEKTGEYEKMESCLLEGATKKDEYGIMNLAMRRVVSGKLQEAEEWLETIYPENEKIEFMKLILMRKIFFCLEKSKEYININQKIHSDLTNISKETGEKFLEILEMIIEMPVGEINVFDYNEILTKGILYEKIGEYEKAEQYYLLAINDERAVMKAFAMKYLILFYFSMERNEEAVSLATKYEEIYYSIMEGEE